MNKNNSDHKLEETDSDETNFNSIVKQKNFMRKKFQKRKNHNSLHQTKGNSDDDPQIKRE
jgi:hypothetical protein